MKIGANFVCPSRNDTGKVTRVAGEADKEPNGSPVMHLDYASIEVCLKAGEVHTFFWLKPWKTSGPNQRGFAEKWEARLTPSGKRILKISKFIVRENGAIGDRVECLIRKDGKIVRHW